MKIYSVKEAAQKLGISDRRVRKLLKEDRIQGEKVGGTWIVLQLEYMRLKRPTKDDVFYVRGEESQRKGKGNE